jgi:hypothetical protein
MKEARDWKEHAPMKVIWSYFIRKVYETNPLICPKCQSEVRIISFIDQPDMIKKILQQLGLWEESHDPPQSELAGKQIKERSSIRPTASSFLKRPLAIGGAMSSPVRNSRCS